MELDARWRAKELEVYLQARTLVELKMMDVSARALGEAEHPEAPATQEEAEKQNREREKAERFEKLGAPLKQKLRDELMFYVAPEHLQAAHIYLHGWPGSGAVKPLQGIHPETAALIITAIDAGELNDWDTRALNEQLTEGGSFERLTKTIERDS